MSRLEELIQELCPNGVAYKTLGEVLEIQRGKRVVKRDLLPDGKYPVYQNSLTPLGYYEKANVSSNTTFVIVAGAAGEIGFSLSEFWAADDCFALICPENILNRYVYHFILGQQAKLKAKVRKASIPRLSRLAIEQLQISVPPLEVQREIVRILDHFTELTTELTAELTARKKQYEYYRDHLLTFGDDVPLVKLGDIATIRTGRKPKHINDEKCGYEYINAGTTNSGYVDEYNCEGDTVTTPSRGQGGIGFVGYQLTPFWLGPLCYKIRAQQDNVLNKYIFYILSSYKQTIVALKKEGGTPAVNASDLGLIKIPLPPLEEQQRIVDILDRFDTLCNDLTAGLPAEIEARQKQYEYYRDKLLDLKKCE